MKYLRKNERVSVSMFRCRRTMFQHIWCFIFENQECFYAQGSNGVSDYHLQSGRSIHNMLSLYLGMRCFLFTILPRNDLKNICFFSCICTRIILMFMVLLNTFHCYSVNVNTGQLTKKQGSNQRRPRCTRFMLIFPFLNLHSIKAASVFYQ